MTYLTIDLETTTPDEFAREVRWETKSLPGSTGRRLVDYATALLAYAQEEFDRPDPEDGS